MIFYGSKAITLLKGQIRNVKCPKCEVDSNMSYHVFGKYAHVYWIPFFPMKNICITECKNCFKTFEYFEFTKEINEKLKREKERNPVKNPIWFYSGLFIITLLICTLIYYDKLKDNNTLDYAKNPKVGDIYYYEVPDMAGHYTTMKINKITSDSIFYMSNNMEIDSKTDMDQILKDEYYTYPDAYSKEEILDLTKDLEIIFKITRD